MLRQKVLELESREISLLQVDKGLLESQEHLDLFLKHCPMFTFFKDENVKAIRLSRNFEELLGRPVSELVGKDMHALFPDELASKMISDDLKILHDKIPVTIEEHFNGRV